MFTGIVEEIGKVEVATSGHLSFIASKVIKSLKLGDSIAVNGACLTAVAISAETFAVDISPETLQRTNLGLLFPGQSVNLELSLSVNDRMGGHIVQGHIDATGEITKYESEGAFSLITFRAPKNIMRYMVEKGFIAIDGASLTIVKRGTTSFAVSVIPYTLENTVMGKRKVGDLVNLEVDILAKYVESLINKD